MKMLLISGFDGRMGSETTAFLVQTLLSGVQGAVAMAGVNFYDIENKHFGLLAASVCHLLLILVTYFPIAFFLNWIATFSEAILMTVIMTASYFIIFLIMYFRYKAEAKKLNELQKKQLNTCHGTAES